MDAGGTAVSPPRPSLVFSGTRPALILRISYPSVGHLLWAKCAGKGKWYPELPKIRRHIAMVHPSSPGVQKRGSSLSPELLREENMKATASGLNLEIWEGGGGEERRRKAVLPRRRSRNRGRREETL